MWARTQRVPSLIGNSPALLARPAFAQTKVPLTTNYGRRSDKLRNRSQIALFCFHDGHAFLNKLAIRSRKNLHTLGF